VWSISVFSHYLDKAEVYNWRTSCSAGIPISTRFTCPSHSSTFVEMKSKLVSAGPITSSVDLEGQVWTGYYSCSLPTFERRHSQALAVQMRTVTSNKVIREEPVIFRGKFVAVALRLKALSRICSVLHHTQSFGLIFCDLISSEANG
jgi:hypothetical protein